MSVVKGPQAIVTAVEPDSIGAHLGIQPGDKIVEVNGHVLVDNLDLQFAANAAELTLLVERAGERTLFEIEKDEEDALGLEFEDETFDGIRRCKNNCVFCFVYQNPKGLRKSLYIKDEDFRYSFMYGNYMTLTNLEQHEMQRIVDQRLSPIYVSVHATDQKVRDLLLGRANSPPLFPRLDFLTKHGIEFYAQLVLCPGINDGAILEKTLTELEPYFPRLRGITGVPVGLTRYRDFLFDLKPYEQEGARAMIEYTNRKQKEFFKRHGTRLFYLADEFYLIAKQPFPPPEDYERFETREDGVGLIPRFIHNMKKALKRFKRLPPKDRKVIIVTGRAAEGMFRDGVIPAMVEAGWPKPMLYPITNQFFGPTITVAGLLTGRDLLAGLKFAPKVDAVLLCDYALKTGTDLFLDDLTITDLERQLGQTIIPVTDSPNDLLHVIRDCKQSAHRRKRSGWETEATANNQDRFHAPLDADMNKLIPLFHKPAAIWPAPGTSLPVMPPMGGCGGEDPEK